MPRQCFFYVPLLLSISGSTSHTHSFSVTAVVSFLFCHIGLLLYLFLFSIKRHGSCDWWMVSSRPARFSLSMSVLPSMGLSVPVLWIIQSLLSSNSGSVLCSSHSSLSSGPQTPLFHGYYNHWLPHPQPVLPYLWITDPIVCQPWLAHQVPVSLIISWYSEILCRNFLDHAALPEDVREVKVHHTNQAFWLGDLLQWFEEGFAHFFTLFGWIYSHHDVTIISWVIIFYIACNPSY